MADNQANCAACDVYRRQCNEQCRFAEFFPLARRREFVILVETYGKSNLNRWMRDIHNDQKQEFLNNLYTEAMVRMGDPLGGSPALIREKDAAIRYRDRLITFFIRLFLLVAIAALLNGVRSLGAEGPGRGAGGQGWGQGADGPGRGAGGQGWGQGADGPGRGAGGRGGQGAEGQPLPPQGQHQPNLAQQLKGLLNPQATMNVDALLNPEAMAANLDGDNALFELHGADGPGHGAGGEGADGLGHGAGGEGADGLGHGAGGEGAEGPGHGAGGEGAEGPGHGAGGQGAGGQPFPPQLMNVLPDPQAPMDALFNPEPIAAMAAYLNEDNAQFQQHLDGLNH